MKLRTGASSADGSEVDGRGSIITPLKREIQTRYHRMTAAPFADPAPTANVLRETTDLRPSERRFVLHREDAECGRGRGTHDLSPMPVTLSTGHQMIAAGP